MHNLKLNSVAYKNNYQNNFSKSFHIKPMQNNKIQLNIINNKPETIVVDNSDRLSTLQSLENKTTALDDIYSFESNPKKAAKRYKYNLYFFFFYILN